MHAGDRLPSRNAMVSRKFQGYSAIFCGATEGTLRLFGDSRAISYPSPMVKRLDYAKAKRDRLPRAVDPVHADQADRWLARHGGATPQATARQPDFADKWLAQFGKSTQTRSKARKRLGIPTVHKPRAGDRSTDVWIVTHRTGKRVVHHYPSVAAAIKSGWDWVT